MGSDPILPLTGQNSGFSEMLPARPYPASLSFRSSSRRFAGSLAADVCRADQNGRFRRDLAVGRPLPSRTGDPILRLCLDRPATVGEVAPHFLPHGAAYLFRQCCECLASGSPTAFKRAVIDIE